MCQRKVCGDGIISAGRTGTGYDLEGCDDGNTQSGDGCDASCNPEPGWFCSNDGRPCVHACGDGSVFFPGPGSAYYETCDDGNTQSGDGCSAVCQQEPGWACPTGTLFPVVPVGGPCHPFRCGDGLLDRGYDAAGIWRIEECDDGNTQAGDGCSPTCTLE
jgi:cysteine-rich repeat protein